MKKLSLLVIFMLVNGWLFAQSEIGFFGGYNYSQLNFKGEKLNNNSESHNTFIIGLDYKIKTEKLIHFGASLNFLAKSFDLNTEAIHPGSYYNNTKYNLDIVSMDIFPEISFGKKVKVFVNAGPSIGFIIKSKKDGVIRFNSLGADHFEVQSGSASSDFHGIDFGIRSAIGISYPVSKMVSVYLETRYTYGLTDLGQAKYFYYGDFCTAMNTKNIFAIVGIHYLIGSDINKK